MCNLHLNVMCMAWCEVECGHDVEWYAEMWWSDWCELWCNVKCDGSVFEMWCNVECCNFRHGVIEMQNV